MQPSQSRVLKWQWKSWSWFCVVLQEITKKTEKTKMGRIRETRKEEYRNKERWERNERDKERRGKRIRDRRGMKYKRLSENRGRRDFTEISALNSLTCAGTFVILICNVVIPPNRHNILSLFWEKKPCSVNAAPVLLETDLLLPSTWRPKHKHWNQVEKEQDKKNRQKKYLKSGEKNSIRD